MGFNGRDALSLGDDCDVGLLFGNVFVTTAPIKAGQHTVTYTLKTGYTGTAKLSVIERTLGGQPFRNR